MSNPETLDRRVGTVEKSLAVLQADVAGIKAGQVEQSSKIDLLISRQSSQGKPNWTALGITVTVIAGLWSLGTLPIIQRVNALEQGETTLRSMASKVAISEVNDAQSQLDRNKLNHFTEDQTKVNASLEKLLTVVSNQIIELETQSRANSQIRNVMVDGIYGIFSPAYEEIMKKPMPRPTYYPDISLPKPTQ